MSRSLSRRQALVAGTFAWLVAIPLVHGGLPWLISRIPPHLGWSAEGPGTWNRLGALPLGGGLALLLWVVATGFARSRDLPERVTLDWSPKLLLVSGPYAWSRNPMYVAELALWLGWAIYHGSVPLALAFATSCAVIALVVRVEERSLEAAYGDAYRRYRSSVPRWFGRRRSG